MSREAIVAAIPWIIFAAVLGLGVITGVLLSWTPLALLLVIILTILFIIAAAWTAMVLFSA